MINTTVKAAATLVLALAGTWGGAASASGDDDADPMVAGIALIAPVPSLELARDGFVDVATECPGVDIEVVERNAEGDLASLQSIIEGFVGEGVDFINPISTPAAQAAYQVVGAAGGTIPVAYSGVTDPFGSGLAEDPATHDDWITGSQSLPPFAAVVDAIEALVPDAQVIGLPYTPSEANSQPVIDAFQAIVDERGLTLETAVADESSDVGAATQALVAAGAEVIVVPTITTIDTGQAAIVQVAQDNGIPVVGSAAAQAQAGAAVAVGADYYGAGARAGEIACAVLSGEATPADFDVINIEQPAIQVNEEAAAAQGVTIPESLLAAAAPTSSDAPATTGG